MRPEEVSMFPVGSALPGAAIIGNGKRSPRCFIPEM